MEEAVTTWTKEPPTVDGWYWVRWVGGKSREAPSVAHLDTVTWGVPRWWFNGSDIEEEPEQAAVNYEFWPIPIPAPEEQA